ncbi:acyl-CoA Delta(11) desaturase-like [Leptopilina boulardi]|uniref:acyl-CoA Delta(11) desaturase-like n=1 Tax=Leptopilina boulardi TaxID=63433 RepID=UPI0021F632A7|nr:acyl-CoA Delta(11) desaturase-like [Leptopilina boulardi]
MVPKTCDINSNHESTLTAINNSIEEKSSMYFKSKLKWKMTIYILLLHIIALYSLLTFPYSKKKRTLLFSIFMMFIAGFGVTIGVHRFWTHRSFKAKWPLRLILLYCYYSCGQENGRSWVRDHRIHHKYTETDADPHNSNRGFFFSHVGWLMMHRHPEVIRRGKQIDMSDIYADPLVAFGENYNRTIAPSENKFVSLVALGEGWHNYHHSFPYDYKCAELGKYSLNYSTFLLDMFAKIGWAYDLKQPSKELIIAVMEKKGNTYLS